MTWAQSISVALLLHYGLDFLLQPRWMAKDKSWRLEVLLLHGLVLVGGFAPVFGLAFAVWNAVIHCLIDWWVWRIYRKTVVHRILRQSGSARGYAGTIGNWKYYEDKMFYDFIGADQLLHVLTLVGLLSAMKEGLL